MSGREPLLQAFALRGVRKCLHDIISPRA